MIHHTSVNPVTFVEPEVALELRSYGLTHPGLVRKDNQDQFLIAQLAKSMHVQQSSLERPSTQLGDDRGYLLVVADGMGGHAGGEQASALAVGTIEDFALNTLKWFFHHESGDGDHVLVALQSALRHADLRVFHEAASHPELRGMATTATIAYVIGASLFVIHVGGSRCYLLRGGRLYQLTHDHTVAQELVDRGVITPELAATHQYSRVVTNAIGGATPGLHAEVHKLPVAQGDVLLLCSDGLTSMVPDARIAEVLAMRDPDAACRSLVDEANRAGGQDNITAIVARLETARAART